MTLPITLARPRFQVLRRVRILSALATLGIALTLTVYSFVVYLVQYRKMFR